MERPVIEPYRIRVEETVAVCDKPLPYYITKNAVGIPVRARFTEEWRNLSIIMVTKGSGVILDTPITLENMKIQTIIPWECLTQAGGKLYIGFYGTDGANVIIPTVWADMGYIYDSADPSGDESADPHIPLYAELLARIENVEHEIQSKSIFWQTWTVDE